MCDLTNPIYNDEDAARKHLETVRWGGSRYCPHCGATEGTVPIVGKKQSHRPGLYYCNECKKQFSVTVGTVFERSHVPLHKWVLAYHLMASSKKGISAHQLHRMLGVTYKTAWFMAHRIRESMTDDDNPPMGGDGSTVEADETYLGGKVRRRKNRKGRQVGIADKMKIVGLVERSGVVRTFHVEKVNSKTVRNILVTNVDRKSKLMTDEANHYRRVGKEFASHEAVHHAAHEYARDNVFTNIIEGFFSIFKRGMKGVYQHCSEAHLKRYLAEFDFRYNTRSMTDAERAVRALRGITGKRLTYNPPRQAANA